MRTADFDFELPEELIAQSPAAQRDHSRLLVLHRGNGNLEHRQFFELPQYLKAGDVLVLNNSKVIRARLRGINPTTRGRFEFLLLAENSANDWWAMVRPGKRAQIGARITLCDLNGLATEVQASVVETNEEGHRRLHFSGVGEIRDRLDALGEVPLPPYIERGKKTDAAKAPAFAVRDDERYQTVFAQPSGSIAAPTAGLHFTETLLNQIRALGVQVCFVTLHVGYGTFSSVKADDLSAHTMHEERYEVSEETARTINEAKAAGRRIVAVGTTTLRVLESVAAKNRGRVEPGANRTRLFIYPPGEFSVVDVLLTNFHLPRSTLLMLASAFAAPGETRGRDLLLSAYRDAIRERYRFFSYGDAMLIV